MKYYKIVFGYDAEDYIGIDETELKKAYYAFLAKKDAVYSGGAVRGAQITAIQPDYHRAMGWNRGWKLGPDDYAQLTEEGVDRAHTHYLNEVKEEVKALISSGQEVKLIS